MLVQKRLKVWLAVAAVSLPLFLPYNLFWGTTVGATRTTRPIVSDSD